MRDAVAFPLRNNLESNDNVLFIKPEVGINHSGYVSGENIFNRCNFARQIATLCEFPGTKSHIREIIKEINSYYKAGIEIDDDYLVSIAVDTNCDINVLRLWKLVQSIKMDMLYYIDHDRSLECYIEEERCGHEGFVLTNDYGAYKVIDRDRFSSANFNLGVQST